MKKGITKKNTYLLAAVLSAALLAAGCGGQKELSPQAPSSQETSPSTQDQNNPNSDVPDEDSQDAQPSQNPSASDTNGNNASTQNQDEPSAYDHPDLEGSVVTIQDNQFEITEIFVEESEDGVSSIAVSEPEKSENKITVIVTDQTQYKIRKVNSDRLTSTMSEGTKEDIKKGSTLNLWGTSDQGTFYADTVVIWIMPD